MDLVEAVSAQAKELNVPQLLRIAQEIELCSNYLCALKDKADVAKSSRWFREPGSLIERKKLIASGFASYMQSKSAINSVTVANYIKSLLREIPGGLVSSSSQELLIEILRGKNSIIMINKAIDTLDQITVRAILGVAPIVMDIIKNIVRLCAMILTDGTIDPIEPQALARIITVTSQDWLGRMENKDPKRIQTLLNEWHVVWGTIISNEQLFC